MIGALAFCRSKTCSKCGDTYPLDEFPPRKSSRDGRHCWCRPCYRAYHAKAGQDWRRRNRERRRQTERARYAANPEAGKARSQRWREKNREATREAARRYYRENQEERLAYAKAYRESNRDLIRERARERYAADPGLYRLRARERSFTGETAAYVAELLTQPCAYCGATDQIEIEHVIPYSKGGKTEPDNLVPACLPCNRSKGAKTPDEWMGVAA